MSSKWAVLIGIDRYHESLGSLKYAAADCRALRDTIVSGPLRFPGDQVLLLDDSGDSDHRPTFANIHQSLSSWLSVPNENDLVFVFFAGHGRLVDGTTYLVPSDATLASIHTLGIPLRNVQDVIERCKAQRKLLVLDACHSGAGRDVCVMAGGMQEAIAQGTGIYTISSCGAEESSHEWDETGHGVFSHFLTEALSGGCPPAADGCVTADRVYEWVHEHVAKWAAQHRCSQTPQRFAKGAGALVLSQSAPDHATLAEQYRRELEETRARLAQIELREAQEQLAQEKDKLRPRKKPRVKPCAVPEWRAWVGMKGPFDSFNWGFAGVGGGVLFGLVGGVLGSKFGALVGVIGALLPGTIIFLFWYRSLVNWRNRYRLHCAGLCLKQGDYVQASAYAFAMGKSGVDAATAGAMVVSLAELAEESADVEQAHVLYRHAAKYWKAPHAAQRLRELGVSR
jgi:uncharacterized caspase-like protein